MGFENITSEDDVEKILHGEDEEEETKIYELPAEVIVEIEATDKDEAKELLERKYIPRLEGILVKEAQYIKVETDLLE